MRCGHFYLVAVALLVLWSSTRAQGPPGMGGMPPMPMPMPTAPGGMPSGPGGMPGGMPSGPGGPGGPGGMLSGMPMAQSPGMSAGPPPPPPPTNNYPNVRSSHCLYLMNAPSLWGTNASPFKLKTQSYARNIKPGYPIEVSIMPFFSNFKYFSFTDYAVWAEPVFQAAPAPGAPPPPSSNLGVWQVFPQYAGGSGSMKCNDMSKGDDTVGSFEQRMLELLKTLFPADNRLQNFKPSARHAVAFLWYPDDSTIRSGGTIKFVANVKAFGQWFRMESNPWTVQQPPRPRPRPRPAPRQQPMNRGMAPAPRRPAPRPKAERKPVDMKQMFEQTLDTIQTMQQMQQKLERTI